MSPSQNEILSTGHESDCWGKRYRLCRSRRVRIYWCCISLCRIPQNIWSRRSLTNSIKNLQHRYWPCSYQPLQLQNIFHIPILELNCNVHPLDSLASAARKVLSQHDKDVEFKGYVFGKCGSAANVIMALSKLRFKNKESGILLALSHSFLSMEFLLAFLYDMSEIACMSYFIWQVCWFYTGNYFWIIYRIFVPVKHFVLLFSRTSSTTTFFVSWLF